MSAMFWVWLAVIVGTAVLEIVTLDLVSIWFTIGAIVPFILAGTKAVGWEIQIVIFVGISAILICSLRNVTKKFLLKNANEKTNVDSLIGKKFRMLERTDFETVGSLKVNDVVWSAVGLDDQTIEKGEIVEVVKVSGNKLTVRKWDENLEKTKVVSSENTKKKTKKSKEDK